MIRNCSSAHKGGSEFVYFWWSVLVNNVVGRKYFIIDCDSLPLEQLKQQKYRKGSREEEGLAKKQDRGREMTEAERRVEVLEEQESERLWRMKT